MKFLSLCLIAIASLCSARETVQLNIHDVDLDFFCEENGALPSNEVSELFADASGEVWLAHGYQLSISSIRDNTVRKIDLPRQFGIVRAFAEDGRHSLWTLTNNSLWRLENGAFVRRSNKIGSVFDLIPSESGSLFLVGETDVSEYKNGTVSVLFSPHWTWKEWPITSGCLDQQGRLWVGSSRLKNSPPEDKNIENAALYMFDPKTEKWRTYKEDAGIRWQRPTVRSAPQRNGVWLLPPGEPPHLFDGEKITEDPLQLKNLREFTKRDYHWALKNDLLLTADTTQLYFATPQKVIHLPLDFFVKDKRFQKSLKIESLLIENEKKIWIGTTNHGAIRINLK